MKPLAFLHRGPSPLYDRLLAEVTRRRLPLFPYPVPMERALPALEALGPLGLAGAVLAEAIPPPPRVALEAEAQLAGEVDFLYPALGGLRGQRAEGVALERFLRGHFAGARALLLGRLSPSLAPFFRPLERLAYLAPSPAEGAAFLARLPGRARGPVLLRAEEALALAPQVDLVVVAGRVAEGLLQPYHALLALVPLEPALLGQVHAAHDREALWALQVEVILEALA